MKKLALSLLALAAIGVAVAWAQTFTMPPPAGVSVLGCVYNSTPPTLTNGQVGFVQCNSTGGITSGGSSGGGSGTTTAANSTIAVTNTFQAALAASVTRKGCLFQNQGTHVMYVFFGVIGSATTSNSLQIQAGQTISCATPGGLILADAVNVTGTAGDAYVVDSQ